MRPDARQNKSPGTSLARWAPWQSCHSPRIQTHGWPISVHAGEADQPISSHFSTTNWENVPSHTHDQQLLIQASRSPLCGIPAFGGMIPSRSMCFFSHLALGAHGNPSGRLPCHLPTMTELAEGEPGLREGSGNEDCKGSHPFLGIRSLAVSAP